MNQKYSNVNGSVKRFFRHFSLLLISLLSVNSFAASILIMGDSLSAAYRLPIDQGWVALLEKNIRNNNMAINIINASISGETTQGGRSRLPGLLEQKAQEQKHYNLVVIELGANDALRGYPLTKTKDNLSFMIEQVQQHGAKILLLGNRIPPNYGRRYSEAFFNIYQELADQYKVEIIPFMLENVALNPNLMKDDGIHPNAKGQSEVLKNIMPKIFSILKR